MNEGKKDRRDPIRTIKPRNFVAKNASATTSGAGAHKDKKKAAKQGETKHKNKEYAESLQDKLDVALAENSQHSHQYDVTMKHAKNPTVQQRMAAHDIKPGTAGYRDRIDLLKDLERTGKLKKEDSDAEYDDEAGMSYGSLHTISRAANGLLDTIKEGDNLPEWCQEKISIAEDYLITVWDYLQSEKEQGVAEGSGGAKYKIKQIGSEGGKDYYISPNTGKKVYKKAKVGDHETPDGEHKPEVRMPYKEGAKVDRQAKHITTSMMKKGKSKKDAEAIAWAHIKHPKKKANEGWTHDSLADQLFEHERTYEEQLQNKLNKQLGK
jgi:hypothetical protein